MFSAECVSVAGIKGKYLLQSKTGIALLQGCAGQGDLAKNSPDLILMSLGPADLGSDKGISGRLKRE